MNDEIASTRGRAGIVPGRADIRESFRRHIAYYSNIQGESALLMRRAEASVQLQYVGRVVFELLQNALDRAREKVVATVIRDLDGADWLVVANDGDPLRLDPSFPYDHAPEAPGSRSDFNALLSLHTSNKAPDDTMGNKGIGFRSVFGVGDRVQVWSQGAEAHLWWGTELHWPATRQKWLRSMESRPGSPDAVG